MDVAQKYQAALPRLKKSVEKSHQYFRENYERFNFFRKFVFQTSLSQDDISLLKALKKPQIEFNVLEAYLSRLRGEFSKQEPSIQVMAGDEAPVDPKVIDVVQGHVKHILDDANKDGFEYSVYTDSLSGGFSVMKVTTEYSHEMSFNQIIKMERVYDPVLCGFDPMARLPHKGDGQYCFELFPKTKDEFEIEYPDVPLDKFKFSKNIEGFSWSYQADKNDVVLLCDYYEKKKRRTKIVKTADGKSMKIDDYNKMVEEWNESGRIDQAPVIVSARWTEIETICRYRFVENKVIEYVETDYKMLPLIFVDGNSVMIRDGLGGAIKQLTRPYVFHAKDTQRLKNFAGQCLANELENMIQHKWIVPQEGLPQQEDYLQAWVDPQQASVLVYKQFADDDVNKQVAPPREVQRVATPPEVTNAFQISDQTTQTILGSYDASLGINDNQLSGIAMVEGATQSNSAAMPYVVGFLQALERAAEIIVNLIPKYFVTSRTIPIVGKDGKRTYVQVNQQAQGQQQPMGQMPQQQMQGMNPMQGGGQGMPPQMQGQPTMGGQQGIPSPMGGMSPPQQQQPSISLDYEENALAVKVEAGVNFEVQKTRNLQHIIALMQASPLFAQFMNTEGLGILIDNIAISGQDQLKLAAEEWQQQQKAMQQQQMQMQQQMPNPEMMKMQLAQEKMQQDMKSDQQQHEIDIQKLENEVMRMHVDLTTEQMHASTESKKADAEIHSRLIDQHMDHHDMKHRHDKEKLEFVHEVIQANKPKDKEPKS